MTDCDSIQQPENQPPAMSTSSACGCPSQAFFRPDVSSPFLFAVLFFLLAGELSGCFFVSAADAKEAALSSSGVCCPVPQMVVRFPGGAITGEELLREIAASLTPTDAPDFPSLRPLPATVMRMIMLDLAATEKGLRADDKQLAEAVGAYARSKGGMDVLVASMQGQGTLADVARVMRNRVLEGEVSDVLGVADSRAGAVTARLKTIYKPKWYMQAAGEVLAKINGRDYTRLDIARYVLAQATDRELELFIRRMIRNRAVRNEALSMGVYRQGMDVMAAMEAVIAPLITPDALKEWLQARSAAFSVYELRLPDKEQFSGGDKKEATTYAATAGKNGDFPKGVALFLCVTPGLEQAPPEAFGLDYIYQPHKRSPLALAPESWRSEILRAAKGAIIAPLPLVREKGLYTAVRYVRRRMARRAELLLPLLKQLRLREEMGRLLEAMLRSRKTVFEWRPALRLKLPESLKNVTVVDIALDELPQVEE